MRYRLAGDAVVRVCYLQMEPVEMSMKIKCLKDKNDEARDES